MQYILMENFIEQSRANGNAAIILYDPCKGNSAVSQPQYNHIAGIFVIS